MCLLGDYTQALKGPVRNIRSAGSGHLQTPRELEKVLLGSGCMEMGAWRKNATIVSIVNVVIWSGIGSIR
jgi:hypothetical protein